MFAYTRKEDVLATIELNSLRSKLLTALGNVALILVVVLAMELIFRGSFWKVRSWITQYTGAFIFNGLVLSSFFGVLVAITGRWLYAWLAVASFASFITTCNYLKLKFLSENIYPWDILSLKQGLSLAPYLQSGKEISLFLLVNIALCWCFYSRRHAKGRQLSRGSRLTLALTSGLFIAMVCYSDIPQGKKLLSLVNINNTMWDYQDSYVRNGFMLSSLLKLRASIVLPAANYNEEQASSIVKQIKQIASAPPLPQRAGEKPTIIMILSEAFWDPMVMREVSFAHDPIPFLRALQPDQPAYLLAPALFGGTSKTEYEALTGFSNSFYLQGSVPFLQYINSKVPSLASLLKDHGYRTIGVHPNDGWFWKRNHVYPLLGFQEFHSIDAFDKPEIRGSFVSDRALMSKVVELNNSSEGPKFIFVVTMQNHAPYAADRYGSAEGNRPRFEAGMSRDCSGSLSCYLQGLTDFDDAVRELVEQLKKSKSPTIMITFGDHLPYLGVDGQTYREAKYIEHEKLGNWTLTEHTKMHSVPIFTWANFPEFKKPFSGTLSAIYLPYHITQMAGIDPPPFYKYLNYLERKVPGLTDVVKIDGAGNMTKDIPQPYKDDIDRYWFIQYDMMFGKKYTQRDLF